MSMAKELYSVDKYEFVTGEAREGYLHGDMDLITINGYVMPCRAGSVNEATGVDCKRSLRGEDICFLLEWGALRLSGLAEVSKWVHGGTFTATAFAATTRTFSRKLVGSQARTAILADCIDTRNGGKLRPFIVPSALSSVTGATVGEILRAVPVAAFAKAVDNFGMGDDELAEMMAIASGKPLKFAPLDQAFVNASVGNYCGMNPYNWTIDEVGREDNYGIIVSEYDAAKIWDLAHFVPSEKFEAAGQKVCVSGRDEYWKRDTGSYYKTGEVALTREDIGDSWTAIKDFSSSTWGKTAGQGSEQLVGETTIDYWNKIVHYRTYRQQSSAAPKSDTVLLRLKTRHASSVKAIVFFWLRDTKDSEDVFLATVIRVMDFASAGDQEWTLSGSQMPSVESLMGEAGYSVEDEKESDYNFQVELGVYPVVFFDDHTKIS